MRRRPPIPFLWLVSGLLLLIVVAAAAQYRRGGETSVLPRLSASLPVWAPQYMAGKERVSRQDAVAAARNFDIISALKGTYRRYVPAMKRVNSDLALLVYVNAAFAQKNQGTAYPDDWYARDAEGAKIRSRLFGTFLMDVSNPGWVQDVAERCEEFLSFSGYDGCMLDVLGTAPLSGGYVSGVPIDPSTGEEWRRAAWMQAMVRITDATRSKVSPRLVIGNGFADGPRFFRDVAPTSALLRSLDGGVAEQWLRHPREDLGTYGTEAEWKQNVDMMSQFERQGRWLLTLTKVWADGSTAQKEAWHRYALGSFLLGQQGRSIFSFVYDEGPAAPTRHSSLWDVQLGRPLGPYSKKDGVYQRDFSGGKVLVNPTTTAQTISLDGSFTSLAGQSVHSVTLAPHDAEILTRA